MSIETAIFEGEHGLNHPRRDGGERHRPAFLALSADERGQYRSVERYAVDRLRSELESLHAIRNRRRLRLAACDARRAQAEASAREPRQAAASACGWRQPSRAGPAVER